MKGSGDGKGGHSFEEQISAMAPQLRFYLRKTYGLSEVQAEDIAQDAIVAAIEAVRSPDFVLDPGVKLATFVHGIAKHKALDFFKAQRVRQHPSLDDEKGKLSLPAVDPGPEIADTDLVSKLKIYISRLPEPEGRILYLIYDRGYKVAEVATELNITAKQVSTLKFTALAKLRQQCSEDGLFLAVCAAAVWWTFWRIFHGL